MKILASIIIAALVGFAIYQQVLIRDLQVELNFERSGVAVQIEAAKSPVIAQNPKLTNETTDLEKRASSA